MSNETPSQNSNVIVYGKLYIDGQPAQDAGMHASWHYKSTISYCDGVTGADGVALCERTIGGATKGYTVRIRVVLSYKGTSYTASTTFTPQ